MKVPVIITEQLRHNRQDIRTAARDVAKVSSGGLKPIYSVLKKEKPGKASVLKNG